MATIIYCNRRRLYEAPKELIEKQDHFRQRAPAEWKKDLGYVAVFQKLYGWDAWMDAQAYDYVPENRDRAYVREPVFEIEVKSADPAPTPAPSNAQLDNIEKMCAETLAIVHDIQSRT